jgi:predicted Ser/Thr protein kinase
MEVPDPVTEEWFDEAMSSLSLEDLMHAFTVVRERGGEQAELLERVLARPNTPAPAAADAAPAVDVPAPAAPADATIVDATVVDRPAAVGGDLVTGSQFAGYEIEGVAGRGGMGVVYRARQLRPSRIVALKVVSPQFAADADFRERFARESEIAASIEHSNVIPVYDVGEESGLLYIAMRYVEGTDLAAMLVAEGRLAPRRAVEILVELTAALDAAHAHGLVHRDIKPGNVLIAQEGQRDHVYLTDFGLAKLASGAGQTRTGLFVGTLDHAAPEQIEGGQVDARTDVYASGCLLYQMLTGAVPFPHEHTAAIMMAHMSAQPRSVRELAPELPAELDAVIARAMAKKPADRYQSAGDLGRAALAAVQGEDATLIERSVATGRAAPGGKTLAGVRGRSGGGPGRRVVALGGGAVVLIVAAILAVSLSGGSSGSSGNHPKRTRTTPVKRPPRGPGTKAYTNTQIGISFRYPANWQPLTLKGSPADFGTGNTAATETRCALDVDTSGGPGETQEAQFAYVRKLSAHADHVYKHYELRAIQAEQGQNITGVGLLRVADGQGGHLGFFFRGRAVYTFDCITPAASLDQVDRQDFEPLFASLRVG